MHTYLYISLFNINVFLNKEVDYKFLSLKAVAPTFEFTEMGSAHICPKSTIYKTVLRILC